MDSKEIGIFGERIAEKYLKDKGYQILDKNYSPKFITGPKTGEIDIVAKKDDIISFVEVKTLSSDEGIQPEEKVDYFKQKKIMKTAEAWFTEKKISLDNKWQIDVLAIKIDLKKKTAKIRHFQNAVF